jgi:hypothetical protein
VSYARKYGEFERRGARVVGISVDPPDHNAAMVDKLRLPFPLLSDPQGALSRAYGVWDEDGRIATPAIFLLDRSGSVRWLYAGRDFADRPEDDALLRAIDEIGEAGQSQPGPTEIRVTAQETEDSVRQERAAISLDHLGPYYRGVYYATVALKQRLAGLGAEGRGAIRQVSQYQRMVREQSEAIQQTIDMRRE